MSAHLDSSIVCILLSRHDNAYLDEIAESMSRTRSGLLHRLIIAFINDVHAGRGVENLEGLYYPAARAFHDRRPS